MAEKKKEEEAPELVPVELKITAEHVTGPHGIELRRKDGKVTDVRTQDFASTEAVGAKTIENILREIGVELPAGDDELIATFSPHTGELIAVVSRFAVAAE